MASVALAAVVVLASIGLWRAATYDNGATPPPAPHVAGLSTTADTAQLAATPENEEATVASRSIPIVQKADSQPFDGPVIWLTNSGDVMYDDGLGAVETIATGVSAVMAGMPNILQLVSEGETTIGKDGNPTGSYTTTYYNLVTGESLVDDGTFSSYLGGPNMYGPLTVLTIADAPNQWSVVNFETMESRSIAELTGGAFPSQESITVSVTENHSAIAIATSQYESESSSTLMLQSGLPGEVAVIPADLSAVTWVSVPEGMPAVGNISLSPDGETLALISAPFNQDGARTTIAVIQVETGEELVRTEPITYTSNAFFQWVENGEAFIVVNGANIERFAIDGSEPTTLLESEGSVELMPRIGVSDILNAKVVAENHDPSTSQFVIINTSTGNTITVEGTPWFRGQSAPEQFSVTLAPVPVTHVDGTTTLVHPVTGEPYSDLPDFGLATPAASDVMILGATRLPISNAAQAPVSVVRLSESTIQVYTTTTAGSEVEEVDLPGNMEVTRLDLSPDGRYLIAAAVPEGVTGTDAAWAVLDLNNAGAGWIRGESGQMLTFIEVRED